MKLLLMNTCAQEGMLALAEDDSILAVESLPGRGSSEHLMPALRRLLDSVAWLPRDLDAVAVVDGPGSFTGVRVGLAAAKGLCEAATAGLVAVSRLALLARAAGTSGEIVALLDAGRGEFFCGLYRDGSCIREELITRAAAREISTGRTTLTCEARVAETAGFGVNLVAEPGPAALLAVARRRIADGAWTEIASADANYIRRTDAELLAKGR